MARRKNARDARDARDARTSQALFEALESRMLLAAALPGDPYAHGADLPFGGSTKAVFIDADGDTVTVSLAGKGSGVVHFNQGGASETQLDAASIEVNDTTTGVLLVKVADKTKGDTDDTGVQQVTVNGSLNALTAPALNLSTGMTVTGTLGKVTLKYASGTINVQGNSSKGSTFTLAGASDLTLNSPSQGISAIKADHWYDNGAADQVSAPLLGTLRIADVFEPRLTLGTNSTPLSIKVLGSANIGASTLGDWTIFASTGAITVGHFGGKVDIRGGAATVRTKDYLGLSAGTGSSKIQIAGKSTLITPGNRLRVQQGATLYTLDAPQTYDLAQLAGYDRVGRRWDYETGYSGALGSGDTTASAWVQGSSTSTTVYTQIGDYLGHMDWTAGSAGAGAGMVMNGVEISADQLGNMHLWFNASQGNAGGQLPAKGTVTSTATVNGTWTDPLNLDAKYGTIDVSLSGTANLSVKTLGYEEVSYGDHHYVAYKVEMKVLARGPLTATVQGDTIGGSYSVAQTQTIWCVPGIGVVKQQGTATIGFRAAGKSGSGTVKSTMLLSDYTG